jgi:hypothetical protein
MANDLPTEILSELESLPDDDLDAVLNLLDEAERSVVLASLRRTKGQAPPIDGSHSLWMQDILDGNDGLVTHAARTALVTGGIGATAAETPALRSLLGGAQMLSSLSGQSPA